MKRLATFIIILLVSVLFTGCNKGATYIRNEGLVFGTTYHVTYESPGGKDLQKGIEAEMEKLGNSLSTFIPASVISKVNQNQDTVLDQYFITVFNRAMEVSEATDGAFDITVAPMVNAWGFGFKHKEKITPGLIDSLKQLVGYRKVKLENGKVIKEHSNTMLDCSAIAKGYASDLVGKYLESKGCTNFMVEIGGEDVAKGRNDKGRYWRIGVKRPSEGAFFGTGDYKAIVELKDRALATSGNYLNFYIEEGKKYAHTIDPKTGYPVQHSLLSATVLADDCMTADAFATAFMVLGLEKSIELANSRDDLEVYFIYADEDGKYQTYASDGFEPLLVREFDEE